MLASLATIMKEKTAIVTSLVYFALTEDIALPDRCPDCGKQIHRSSSAVRPATDKEIADLLRVRAEDEAEQKLTACG